MATADDDLCQENPPVIVDCDVLEAAKENVQPLAAGRRVTALSAILSTPHAQREAQLSATRNRLRINVEIALGDDDDDPLEAYCNLVNWTVENYPQGHSAESGLLELLEEATRVLKDDRGGKWRMELKYLKLWVSYATYVERPVVIYKFLLANEIGTSFALFYEEYAAVLEREGQRIAADEIYTLGIARQAAPLDRLQNRHREFQKRMMTSAPLPAAPPPAAASTTTTRRTVLGTTSAPAAATLPPSRSGALGGPSQPAPNARMQIFVDPAGSEGQHLEGNAWPDLGARKTRVKENVPEVKKMGGTTLRQAGKSKRVASGSASSKGSAIIPYRDPSVGSGDVMPPPTVPPAATPKTLVQGFITPFRDGAGVSGTPKFMPFRDEEAANTTSTHPGIMEASLSASDSAMKLKKVVGSKGVSMTEVEALRKDPLKNYELGDV